MTDQHVSAARLTEPEFRALYDRLRAGPAWGPRDRRGALNYLTPDLVAAACRDVRLGRAVSMAAELPDVAAPDNPEPVTHELGTAGPDGGGSIGGDNGDSGAAGNGAAEPGGAGQAGLAFAIDRFAMNVHGDADSHLDALCHVMYDGRLYNDVDPAEAEGGVRPESVEMVKDGIVGRGVLLDIPRLRGLPWLDPGDHVTAADLAGAEAAQGVRVGRGDLLFVRVGHRRRRSELGAWDAATRRAGLHPEAMEFVAERQVAVLGSDSNSDTAPSAADGVQFPVHVLAINALGVHLLDYLQFEDLVPLCELLGRWSFLCVIAPLRLAEGTGSPVNPIAVA
ncbi:MAG TPA: cyclase family protein [Streptosporangiaceae bacterium]|nr:cyclase family protein [Streptosporangiaceae bacterium]